MIDPSMNDLAPCLIYIDKEGIWHHKGVEMIRRDFIRMFFANMALDSQGRYVITWGGKQCYVDVADTAFVVRNVRYEGPTEDHDARYVLSLSDDSKEDLAPETLYVGRENVLYCRVKDSAFPARFNRAAYYKLAGYVKEENDAFYLPLNNEKYEIKGIL